jgi:uncharacterized protein YndB with AHSA1/START domain
MNPSSSNSLSVSQRVNAPPQRVFNAWIDPSDLVNWIGPGNWRVTHAETDPRTGGSFRFRFHLDEEGRGVEISGVYREFSPSSRLVFTWNPTGDLPFAPSETVVTVDLIPIEGGTEVRITHEGFGKTELRNAHNQGWLSCCAKLVRILGPSLGNPK